MRIDVKGQSIYAYTGGKAFNPEQPTVVMIHGVLNDHSVWILQSRYLAHHGFNVLAIDLPGHCRSQGHAPASVEEAAQFIADLLELRGFFHAGGPQLGLAHCIRSCRTLETTHHAFGDGGHSVSDESDPCTAGELA